MCGPKALCPPAEIWTDMREKELGRMPRDLIYGERRPGTILTTILLVVNDKGG